MKNSNWVTFEDDVAPSKPLQPPPRSQVSLPRPNGLKLELPPVGGPTRTLSPVGSPSGLNGSCVPCNTPHCAPGSGVSPFHFGSWEKSNSPTSPSPGPGTSPRACIQTSDGPHPFPSFQGSPGHSNPFWESSCRSVEVEDSSSSDSESDSAPPRFFIRTKDGAVPPRDHHLQSSYSYICHKLEGLRAEKEQEAESEWDGSPGLRFEKAPETPSSEASSRFVPQGLFRSQKRDGWSLMLRIPEKKNRMSSRQWGPIYLRLLQGGVLQMFYERGLEKPFKEFQLLPSCRLSDLKQESYGEPRKILTVKVEHFSYVEKKRYHPKLEVSHEAEVEQLLKFGTTEHGDMEDLLASMEEEIFRLPTPRRSQRHYEEQELSLQITDHMWVQLDPAGGVMEQAAFTQIHCLAFLNEGECFLALNDLGLLRLDSGYGSEDEDRESWMEIGDWRVHGCVDREAFRRSRLLRFSPPVGCRVELLRYSVATPTGGEPPFWVKAVVTVQGASVELQAFLHAAAPFPLCENVVIRVPVPAEWVRESQAVPLLRQRSLKSRMNRNACLGSVGAAESQPVMQATLGSVKYENVFSSIVWRIERLPAKNTALEQPHCFSCKLELGSDQDFPRDWYPFLSLDYEIMGAVVSRTRVRTLGTVSDIQPQKHVTSWTRYHCEVQIQRKWAEPERRAACSTQ